MLYNRVCDCVCVEQVLQKKHLHEDAQSDQNGKTCISYQVYCTTGCTLSCEQDLILTVIFQYVKQEKKICLKSIHCVFFSTCFNVLLLVPIGKGKCIAVFAVDGDQGGKFPSHGHVLVMSDEISYFTRSHLFCPVY